MAQGPKVLTTTNNLCHRDWLKYRQMGIGGSDAGAIAGLNPWQSPIAVYRDKIGEADPVVENERMRIGKDLEDYVAQRFAEQTGLKVRRRNAILQHPEHEWMLANIDRWIVGENEGLECKVTNSYARGDWEGDIPPFYEIQCHHYMAVTGADAWWIAALIGNEKVSVKKITRDKDIIADLISIEKTFWEDYVTARVMPPPDGSDSAAAMIKQMYPRGNGESIEISREYLNSINRIQEIDTVTKSLKEEQDKLKQEIQVEMGEAETAVIGDRMVRWSTVFSNRLDSKKLKEKHPEIFDKFAKESVSRRFTIK